MHEMGIVLNILHTIERVAKSNNIKHVGMVEVEIGELSGVVPAYLKSFWPVATDNTVCFKSQLVTRVVRTVAKCLECGENYNVTDNLIEDIPTCPKCGSTRWRAVAGDQVELCNIGVDEEG